MKITTLEQLKSMEIGQVIELGEFDNGIPLVARVKKPNLMSLVANGKIPNPLMQSAMSLFEGDKEAMGNLTKDAGSLKDFFGLMEVLAKECLVEPSMEDLSSVGVSLSQEQMLCLLMYVQGGTSALNDFRKKSGDNKGTESESDI